MESLNSVSGVYLTRITEVRIKLAERTETNNTIVGYVSVILNGDLFVADLKVIERPADGKRFVSFPSRKVRRPCQQCHHPTALRDNFCSFCGKRLEPVKSENGERIKLHEDIVHPICRELRQQFESIILCLVQFEELSRTRPGYRSSWDYPFRVSWNHGRFESVQSKEPVVHRDTIHRERYPCAY